MDHEFSSTDQRCVHCGTLRAQFDAAPEKNPCPRRGPEPSGVRPEPTARRYAVDDSDTISARLAELRAERDAAWNTPAGDQQ